MVASWGFSIISRSIFCRAKQQRDHCPRLPGLLCRGELGCSAGEYGLSIVKVATNLERIVCWMFAGKLRSILDPLNSIRYPLDPFSKFKNSATCRICRELVPVEVGAGPRGCSVPEWFRGFSLYTSPPMRCDVCVCVYIYLKIQIYIYI